MKTVKIAIDGPSGAGKSTIAKELAKRLGYIYIDTGAMYRTVGLYMINNNIKLSDKQNIVNHLDEVNIYIKYYHNEQQVYLNGNNVSSLIRTPDVSAAASAVATISEVRLKMVELQRKLATNANVIMDGRDIGTYVLPDADFKIFLTASVDERAKRRFIELQSKGIECTVNQVKNDMIARDKNDSEREASPLKAAEDSITVDTTGNSLSESISIIEKIIMR